MRRETAPETPDRRLARLARRQHGVVSVGQVHRLGLTEPAIRRRVRSGRLHRLHRGVYAVGHLALTPRARMLAAVLAAGPGAVLSHRGAATLWGLEPTLKAPIDVTVASRSGRAARQGIRVHRPVSLEASAHTIRDGIPVTAVGRTLDDLARVLPPDRHARLVNRARDLGLVRGDPFGDVTRSHLERRFLALCTRHGIRRPVVNGRVGRYEVDFHWRDQRVVVETDGRATHDRDGTFETDRIRDSELVTAGWRVVRFTYARVFDDGPAVGAILRALLREP